MRLCSCTPAMQRLCTVHVTRVLLDFSSLSLWPDGGRHGMAFAIGFSMRKFTSKWGLSLVEGLVVHVLAIVIATLILWRLGFVAVH